MFCMLQPTTQLKIKKDFVIDEPKYTRNTSVYYVTDYICLYNLSSS